MCFHPSHRPSCRKETWALLAKLLQPQTYAKGLGLFPVSDKRGLSSASKVFGKIHALLRQPKGSDTPGSTTPNRTQQLRIPRG